MQLQQTRPGRGTTLIFRQKILPVFVLVLMVLAWNFSLAAVTHPWRDNLTRADVVNAMGDPVTSVKLGVREVLDYGNGVRIELQNGVVTNITGTVPDVLKPAAAVPAPASSAPATSNSTAATPANPTAPAQPVAATPATPANSSVPKPAPSASATPAGAAPAASNNQAAGAPGVPKNDEQTIDDLSTGSLIPPGTKLPGGLTMPKDLSMPADSGMTSDSKGEPQEPSMIPSTLPGGMKLPSVITGKADTTSSPWTRANTPEGFITGWLLKTILMFAVLKGIFVYKDFPVTPQELVPLALGVATVDQFCELFYVSNDFGAVIGSLQPWPDNLVTGCVLLPLIMKYTAAKNFPTAAGITVTAMSANVALYYAKYMFL